MKTLRTAFTTASLALVWAMLAMLFPFQCYGQTQPSILGSAWDAVMGAAPSTRPIALAPPQFGLLGHVQTAGFPLYIAQPIPAAPPGLDGRRLGTWWTLTDPRGKQVGEKLPGNDVAFLTDGSLPGRYVITRICLGTTSQFPIVIPAASHRWIFVDPDNGNDAGPSAGSQASPRRTVPPLAGQSGVGVYFKLGSKLKLASAIDLRGSRDIWFGTWNKSLPAQPNAMLVGPMGAMFQTDGGTADITFTNLNFDGNGQSTLGHWWGSDYALKDCYFTRGLDTAILIDGTGVDGLYLDGVTGDVLNEYSLMLLSVRRPQIINCHFAGSKSQITVRATRERTSGCGIEGGLFFNDLICQPEPTGYKAAMSIRCANQDGKTQTLFSRCTFVNGNASVNTEGGQTDDLGNVIVPFPTVQRGLFFDSCITEQSTLEIHNGCRDMLNRNWTLVPHDSQGVTVQAAAAANPPTGIVFENTTCTSTHAAFKILGAVSVGVGKDLAADGTTLHGPKGTPIIKSDDGALPASMLGGTSSLVVN